MFKKFILLFTAIAIVSSACNKQKNTTGTVTLQVDHKVSGAPFAYNTTFTNNLGQDYTISLATIYLSQFTFDGGAPQTLDGKVVALTPDVNTYPLGELKTGDYQNWSFAIGLDSITNHADPTTFPADHPLNPTHPRYQHWAWNTGYIFVKLEGQCDTMPDGSGNASTFFTFHLGLDQLMRQIEKSNSFSVKANETTVLSLVVDYGSIFNALDFSKGYKTHTMNDLPLATSVMNATVTAFE